MMESILQKFLQNASDAEKAEVATVINRIVTNCWQMVQISPPMSLGLEPSCDKDDFDRKLLKSASESDDKNMEFEDHLKLPGRKLELLRPILFFTPHGIYKKPGEVAIVSSEVNTSGT